jgi:hypothetical protein
MSDILVHFLFLSGNELKFIINLKQNLKKVNYESRCCWCERRCRTRVPASA